MRFLEFISMVLVRWQGEWTVLGRNQAMKMLLAQSEEA